MEFYKSINKLTGTVQVYLYEKSGDEWDSMYVEDGELKTEKRTDNCSPISSKPLFECHISRAKRLDDAFVKIGNSIKEMSNDTAIKISDLNNQIKSKDTEIQRLKDILKAIIEKAL